MNCLPYDLKINAEVPMQQRIARVVGRKDWQFRVCRHEFGEVLCDVSAGLSNDLKADAAVKAAGYTDAQIIEIVLHVALNTWTNYINTVAETEIDFPVVKVHKVA